MKSFARELVEKEKDQAINLILVIFAVAGTFVTSLSLIRIFEIGMAPALWVQIIFVSIAIVVAIIRKRLPLLFKVLFAITINIVIGLSGIITLAMIDSSVMVLITGVIIAATLGSTRIAVAIVIFSVLVLTVLAVLVLNDMWIFDIDANAYMYQLPSWLVFIVAFAVLSLLTIYVVGKMSDIAYSNIELLQEQKEQLAEVNKTKDKLFQMIAHDLRSPFQGLIHGLELFSDEGDIFNEEQREKLFRSMLRDSTSTFSMLENLLYWSRAQTGDLKINSKYIEVDELVKASINPYVRIAERKGISLDINIPPSTLIYGDESSLKIVLSNLINNAIKFTDKNGKISITANKKSNKTEIHVSDNGIGIKKQDMNKLFDSDKNFSTRGTDNEKGTGLGLGISYELVQLNGGEISVKENVAGGTTFTLLLPAEV